MVDPSPTADFAFQTSVISMTFIPEPILDALERVMENLVPLVIGTGSLPADQEITDELRFVLERFVKAIEAIFMTTRHMSTALYQVRSMLGSLDKMRPSHIAARLREIAEGFLCGSANAIDAQKICIRLKEDIEQKFKLHEDNYGPDAVIKVTTQGGVERVTVHILGAIINRYIKQLERSCAEMTTLIQGTNELLRVFLQDDQFSLENPLTDAPLWSKSLFMTWKVMADSFDYLESSLKYTMCRYPAWFVSMKHQDEILRFKLDKEARNHNIVQPEFKIKVPKDPEPKPPSYPISIVRGAIESGQFEVSLESVEPMGPGVASIKLHHTACHSNHWFNRLKKFSIICRVADQHNEDKLPSPIRFINIKPASRKDIKADTVFEPKKCRPVIEVDTSTESTVKWTFSRPFYRWDSASFIPSELTISFEVVHRACVELEFWAVFEYHRSFILPFITDEDYICGSRPIVLEADSSFLDTVSPRGAGHQIMDDAH